MYYVHADGARITIDQSYSSLQRAVEKCVEMQIKTGKVHVVSVFVSKPKAPQGEPLEDLIGKF